MERYIVVNQCSDYIPEVCKNIVVEEYEILFDTHKNLIVCHITEPEDRNFSRDLKPVVDELNRLSCALYELASDYVISERKKRMGG